MHDTTVPENPKKRPSPEPKTNPVGHLVDVMAGAPGAVQSESDDEVELPQTLPVVPPVSPPKKWVPKCHKFRGLNSILCSYKLKEVNPKDPKQKNITFEICADVCKDEMKMIKKWDDATKAYYHPMILSALKVVFQNKIDEWYRSPFLLSPEGVTQYWLTVLEKRSDLWT
jgi:hypothetical protein